jgi:hypothetical protein
MVSEGHAGAPRTPRVTARRAAVLLALGILFFQLFSGYAPEVLLRRLRFLRHYASQELMVRRLGGSGAAFDRNYVILLEWARRRLPPGTKGLAVFAGPIPVHGVHLTLYHFTPVPALVEPRRVPPGWIALVYGTRRPEGWRVLTELPHGALLDPAGSSVGRPPEPE